MFTGLVKTTGKVERVMPAAGGARLVLSAVDPRLGVAIGDSVAVSGVCLTAVEAGGGRLAFDITKETLDRTTLGSLGPGARVNLEPALAAGDPLGGHFVTGHVDGVATLASRRAVGEGAELVFEADAALVRDVVPKGSVAVDGVSLTVAKLEEGRFAIAAIPLTLAETTLGDLAPGARVNVETDMLVKAVRRVLEGAGPASGLTLDFLRDHGFA